MIDAALLRSLREYLQITWRDAELDRVISGLAMRGMAFINRFAGKTLDYADESMHRQLLFDFVLYARDGALEAFGKNYSTELNTLAVDSLVDYDGGEDDGSYVFATDADIEQIINNL